MIIGVGTDIVQIPRIEQLLKQYKSNFIERILEMREIERFNSLSNKIQANFLAKRFAAKEAIGKAFGVGISNTNLAFKDIAIFNDSLGKPYVEISQQKLLLLAPNQQPIINLSITDDYPITIAFCVISVDRK